MSRRARTSIRRFSPEWLQQLVTVHDRRGFSERQWQKLRERNKTLDCAVLPIVLSDPLTFQGSPG